VAFFALCGAGIAAALLAPPRWNPMALIVGSLAALALLTASGKTLVAGLSFRTKLWPTIVNFLRTHGFDLFVVGFMEHSALYNRIIGSTTDRLVELAPRTVLVVK
jgi:nucleotide-binding universal stress UspA family protein